MSSPSRPVDVQPADESWLRVSTKRASLQVSRWTRLLLAAVGLIHVPSEREPASPLRAEADRLALEQEGRK